MIGVCLQSATEKILINPHFIAHVESFVHYRNYH